MPREVLCQCSLFLEKAEKVIQINAGPVGTQTSAVADLECM